jgi:hypothetical protein
MATLTNGQSATLSLDAFASVSVQCDGGVQGTLVWTSSADNLKSDVSAKLTNKTYGPYGVPGALTITVTAGRLIYTVNGTVNGLPLDQANSPAAATANTTTIQNALTAGGLVQITTPGTYYINASLTIYAYTKLKGVPGVNIKMLGGITGIPCIQNYAFTQRGSPATITLSWSSGMTAAITGWTAHGCVAGDYVYMQGATLSCYNIVGYLSAANSAAGTATVQLLRLPSGAVSGTITALKVDRDISIEDITFDYNSSNTPAATGLLANNVNLCITQNLTLRNVGSRDAYKYAFMTGACRDMHAENTNIPSNRSDAFKVFGPAVNVKVVNTFGACTDDGVSVQPRVPSAYPLFQWTNGDCIDVDVDGTDLYTAGAFAVLAYYPSGSERMIGMKASRIGGGTIAGNMVKITGEHGATDVINDLDINIITGSALDGFAVAQSGGGMLVKRLKIRGLQTDFSSASATLFRQFGTTTIESADIEVVVNDTSNFGASTQYAAVFNGVYHDVRLCGKIGGGAASRLVNCTTTTAGALGTMRISIDQRAGDNCCVVPSTAAADGVFIFDGCDTTIAQLFTIPVNATVSFVNGNKIHNASGGMVRTTLTPTVKITSDGSNVLTGTSVWMKFPSGTPVVSCYGWDIVVNPIAADAAVALATTAGQYITSSQATTEGGPAICGAAGWVALGTGSLGVNTVIT